MLSASLRAYQGGPETLPPAASSSSTISTRCRSPPHPTTARSTAWTTAFARWFGADLDAANRALSDERRAGAARAQAYKRVLALILSARRPSYYLVEDREALEEFTDSYLRIMSEEGVIDDTLRDAALAQRLEFRTRSPPLRRLHRAQRRQPHARAPVEPARRPRALRPRPARCHRAKHARGAGPGVGDPAPALAARPQDRSGSRPQRLSSPRRPGRPGAGDLQLHPLREDPGANRVRVQTDNFDQPFDINAGARLDLGSSAKLRTLITYLEVVAASPRPVRAADPDELARRSRCTGAISSPPGPSSISRDARDKGAPAPCWTPRWSGGTRRAPGRSSPPAGAPQAFHNFEPRGRLAHHVGARCLSAARSTSCSSGSCATSCEYHLYREPESLGRILEDPTDPRARGVPHALRRPRRQRVHPPVLPEIPGQDRRRRPSTLLVGGVRPTPAAARDDPASVEPRGERRGPRALLAARAARRRPGRRGDRGAPRQVRARRVLPHGPRVHRAACIRSSCGCSTISGRIRARACRTRCSASAAERQEVYGWLFKTSRQERAGQAHREPARARRLPRDPARLGAPRLSFRARSRRRSRARSAPPATGPPPSPS